MITELYCTEGGAILRLVELMALIKKWCHYKHGGWDVWYEIIGRRFQLVNKEVGANFARLEVELCSAKKKVYCIR